MIELILSMLIKALAPKTDDWIISLVLEVIPGIFSIVDLVEEQAEEEAAGDEKFAAAAEETGKLLDSAFDEMPEWRDLSEEKRDVIITGLVELAKFVAIDLGGVGDQPRRARRDVRRAINRALKKARQTKIEK